MLTFACHTEFIRGDTHVLLLRISSLLTGRAVLRYGPFLCIRDDLQTDTFLLLTGGQVFRNVSSISRPVRRGDKN